MHTQPVHTGKVKHPCNANCHEINHGNPCIQCKARNTQLESFTSVEVNMVITVGAITQCTSLLRSSSVAHEDHCLFAFSPRTHCFKMSTLTPLFKMHNSNISTRTKGASQPDVIMHTEGWLTQAPTDGTQWVLGMPTGPFQETVPQITEATLLN